MSIQRFSSVVDTLSGLSSNSDSQKRVDNMRSTLIQCKKLLECKRFDLLHLWVKGIQIKEMSRILDIMYVSPKQVTIFKKLPKALNFLLKIRGFSPASKN
jgi:hypothetical protein